MERDGSGDDGFDSVLLGWERRDDEVVRLGSTGFDLVEFWLNDPNHLAS